MDIDQLPVELLIKIFGYLDNLKEISIVNKHFYEIACKVNDSKIILRINKLTDSELLNSMQTSNRQISKIEIVGPAIHLPVIENFSTTLKFFKLEKVTMGEPTFLEILSLIPNVEHLDVSQVYLGKEVDTSNKRFRNDELNLKKLKSLSIAGCDNEFVAIFIHLPADCLTELQMSGFRWPVFKDLAHRQQNIKALSLRIMRGDHDSDMDVFDKLKLEYLVLHPEMNGAFGAAILSKQTELKSMKFSHETIIDDHVMNPLANNPMLEVLSIDVGKTSDVSFGNFRNLTKLKDLTLKLNDIDDNAEKLKIFAESDHTSMEKLDLIGRLEMTVGTVSKLARSAPHLKHLKITSGASKLPIFAIMSNFNFVEVLEIRQDECFIDQANYSNPKLRELTIFGRALPFKMLLTKISASYPNLRRLTLHESHSREYDAIRLKIGPILNGCTKLEFLNLTCRSGLIIDDWDYFDNHKTNLKFVYLEDLSVYMERLEENRLYYKVPRKLSEHFGVVDPRDRCIS